MSLHLKVSSPSASGVLKGGGGGDGFLVKNLQVPKTTVSRVADIEEFGVSSTDWVVLPR